MYRDVRHTQVFETCGVELTDDAPVDRLGRNAQ